MIDDPTSRILDSLSVPILLIDRNYFVVAANAAMREHLGRHGDTLLGETCYRATHHEEQPCRLRPGISCPARAARQSGVRERVLHRHSVNGDIVIEEIVATPLGDSGLIVEEFRNVTELLGLVNGFLPSCSGCGRLRDEDGSWKPVEGYLHDHTGADFTHTLCPTCIRRLYPDITPSER
ncbi:MAG: PAS domain-containing protein [Acidobacteriota bacterium]|jgi:PAS domain-containing protein